MNHLIYIIKQKTNLHCARGSTPKRETSGGARLGCGLALGRHCADLTGPEIEPRTFRTDSVSLTTKPTSRLYIIIIRAVSCDLKT